VSVGAELDARTLSISVGDRLRVRRIVDLHLELGHGALLVHARVALQELEVGDDQVLLDRLGRRVDAGDGHLEAAESEAVADRQMAPRREPLPEQRRVAARLERRAVSFEQLDATRVEELLRRHAVERDHVEARAAVAEEDLDRQHALHARHARDRDGVVLRQERRLRAVAVLAVDDERARRLAAGERVEPAREALDEHERHRARDAADRERRAQLAPAEVAERELGELHVCGLLAQLPLSR
jgi:hypothetical protein